MNVLRPNALLLFEVFDLGAHVRLDQHPDGVRPLCWAFLRVLSQRGAAGEIELTANRVSTRCPDSFIFGILLLCH